MQRGAQGTLYGEHERPVTRVPRRPPHTRSRAPAALERSRMRGSAAVCFLHLALLWTLLWDASHCIIAIVTIVATRVTY